MGQDSELLTLREIVFELNTLATLLYGNEKAAGLVEELIDLAGQLKSLSAVIKSDVDSFRSEHKTELAEMKESIRQISDDLGVMKDLGSAREWVKNVKGEIALQLAEDPNLAEMLAMHGHRGGALRETKQNRVKQEKKEGNFLTLRVDTSKPALVVYLFAVLGITDLLARIWKVF